MPSLIQPLLRTMTPACHPPHLNPALFKSHSQQLPSSRCIESAHPLQCDSRFLAGGASDTALGLLGSLRFWSENLIFLRSRGLVVKSRHYVNCTLNLGRGGAAFSSAPMALSLRRNRSFSKEARCLSQTSLLGTQCASHKRCP